MLCPRCGTDVGSSPRLCDRCAEEKKKKESAEAPPEQTAAPAAEEPAPEPEPIAVEESEPPPAVKDQKPPSTKKPGKKFGLLLGAGAAAVLIICGGAFYFFSGLELKVPQASPSSSTNAGPVVLDLAKIQSPAEIVSKVSGSFSVNQSTIAPLFAHVLYNPMLRRMEIGFFRLPLGVEAQQQLARLQGFADLPAIQPDIMISILLKRDATLCDRNAVDHYSIAIKNINAPPLPAQPVDLSLTDNSGISVFNCRLDQLAAVQLEMAQQTFVQIAGKANTPVRWELKMSGPVTVLQAEAKIHYDSRKMVTTLAVWNKKDSVVEVGFFAVSLTPEEKNEIRSRRDLQAVNEKKPVIVASLFLAPGATELLAASVLRYGVTFYRNRAAGIDFPGAEDKQGFFFVVNPEKIGQLSGLQGYLIENEVIRGQLKHEAVKVLDQVSCKFSWDLLFDLPLVDVLADHSAEEIEAMKRLDQEAQQASKTDTGPYARLMIGSAAFEFSTVMGLYYSGEGDLAIGFYGYTLTAAEKEQVKKNKEFWRYVNNKRPNMVIFLDFKREAAEASLDNLISYTVYLHRDKIGSFFFPGGQDQLSFKKLAVEFAPDEIQKLIGALKTGGTVSLKMRGEHTSKTTANRFVWDVNSNIEIFQAN